MKSLWEQLKLRPLVGDGAMGTLLFARGVGIAQCLEALVMERPTLIASIHEEYARAGADILTTHTFGANRLRLAQYGFADQVGAFNQAAVHLAQSARDVTARDLWIAGNVGPVGLSVAWEDAAIAELVVAAYSEQISGLVEAGVDMLIFETFSDLVELSIAVRTAQHLCALPIIASMSYGADGRTLAGQSVEMVMARLTAAGVDVLGANCSVGPAQMLTTLKQMRQAAPLAHLSVSPNAGLPVADETGQMHYPIEAMEFATYVDKYIVSGAHIMGGCCGTTPEYTAAMRAVVDRLVS